MCCCLHLCFAISETVFEVGGPPNDIQVSQRAPTAYAQTEGVTCFGRFWKILLTKIDLIRSTSLASVFFSSRRGQILDMLSCGIFSHWSRADSTQPHLAPRSVSQVSGELTGLQPGWWRNMRSGN